MRKGFTLIELLAVIVILAIIAVIAVPIVLNVINNSKESSTFRSAEFYINALDEQIMLKDLNEDEEINPTVCTIMEDGNANCDGFILKIEIDGEKPHYGTIIFKDSKVIDASLAYDNLTVKINSEGDFVNSNTLKICEAVTSVTKTTGNIPGGKYLPGDEYICEVAPGLKYNFFVLSKSGDKVNLILDRNINSDGTLVTREIELPEEVLLDDINGVHSTIYWIASEDYEVANQDRTACEKAFKQKTQEDGTIILEEYDPASCNDESPITALNYLNNALQSWTNIPNLNEVYEDENVVETANRKKGTTGYGTIKLTGKARLPKYNEVVAVGCLTEFEENNERSCPLWLANYLRDVEGEGSVVGKSVEGYWLMSSTESELGTVRAWTVKSKGFLDGSCVHYSHRRGVRPVVTLSKKNFID